MVDLTLTNLILFWVAVSLYKIAKKIDDKPCCDKQASNKSSNGLIKPCFCGNADKDEFIIKRNKMTCLCCNTTRGSSTTQSPDEMIEVWNSRGVCPIDLNTTKADAISEMIGNMPAAGFSSEREKNNWIGDYIHDLRNA